MPWDKREVIGLLRLEIENIRRRGFGVSFRDTVLCLNAGGSAAHDSCDQCILLEFVPPEHRRQEQPCFHIPLDAAGNTVDSLAAQGKKRECEQAILAWMERTLERLEKELVAQRASGRAN